MARLTRFLENGQHVFRKCRVAGLSTRSRAMNRGDADAERRNDHSGKPR